MHVRQAKTGRKCALGPALAARCCTIPTPVTAPGPCAGAAQTLAAFVRAVGPALGGLSWAVSLRLAVPGHQYLAFAFVAIGLAITRTLYGCVRLPNNAAAIKAHAAAAME